MKIYQNINDIKLDSLSSVTVGSFDGVHIGHQKIFDYLKKSCKAKNSLATIVTFNPHPRKILGNTDTNLKILTNLDEKISLFKNCDIDQLLIINFSKEFSRLSYHDFVKNILVEKLNVCSMVIGYGHHFGRNREGGLDKLKKLGETYGFSVQEVSAIKRNGKIVSSSVIRNHVEDGHMNVVSEFLGRCYSLTGTVVHGDGRGQKLGYPTANLEIDDLEKVIPKRGVYEVDVRINKQLFKGMMNIGIRPTFNFDPLTLEVHIFNFDAKIYQKKIEIFFKRYIREETKFENEEALKTQLEKDKKECE
jgi:riboflavin kinase/FMN adenylyltransferase